VGIDIGDAASYDFKANSTSGYSMIFDINDTAGVINVNSSSRNFALQTNSVDRITLKLDDAVVINEPSANVDFRVESDNNANMLFVDAGNNRVGIGSSSPNTILEILDSNPKLRLEDTTSGSKRLDIGVGSDAVAFVDAPQSAQSLINRISGTTSLSQYHSSSGIVVNESGADRDFRVESNSNTHALFVDAGANNVGIFDSSPSSSLSVNSPDDTTVSLELNGGSGNSKNLLFKQLGTTQGKIRTVGDVMEFGVGSSATEIIRIDIDGLKFKGDTAAASALDDYEEGTFIATLKGGTTEPTPLVTTTGYYTKIGRTVTYNISFENKDTTGYSGSVSVSGLPFANGFGRHTAAAGVYNTASWVGFVIGVSGQATTTIDLMDIRSASAWASATHSAGTTRYLWLSGTYMTTA